MNNNLQAISSAWEMDGFLGLLRDQILSFEKGNSFLLNLKEIDFDDTESIDKEYVRNLWYIPIFMEWKSLNLKDILASDDYKRFVNLKSEILNELERILDVP
ncbi:hypothetical protein [Emticicia sp. TH156]|uniref:hypothetical protein n=1 Tax=Emticicia sp. TH156 TaxID=2067454 RepID=UPI000CC3FEEE|nr:hypothetical protein [Emticicia sp. TH156]PLK42143.1 hypothetical protein C0V77_22425 [Emticicia sp. TH156]